MPTFLDRKLAQRFTSWDYDGNGYLQRVDFLRAADRLGDAFGHPQGSPHRQRMRDMHLQLWKGMAQLADANDDGRISPLECGVAFTKFALEKPGAFESAYAPFVDTLMSMADRDGDGKLDRQEFQTWIVTDFHLSDQDASTAFDKLDTNGDGRVTRNEIFAALREYYSSDDPQAPGNWLVGTPPRS